MGELRVWGETEVHMHSQINFVCLRICGFKLYLEVQGDLLSEVKGQIVMWGRLAGLCFGNKQEMKTISRSCKSKCFTLCLTSYHLDKLSEMNLTNIMDYVILFSLYFLSYMQKCIPTNMEKTQYSARNSSAIPPSVPNITKHLECEIINRRNYNTKKKKIIHIELIC